MLTDNSEMPWGKYKGTKMANVPAWYLCFLDEKGTSGEVHDYVRRNRDVLEKQKKEGDNGK